MSKIDPERCIACAEWFEEGEEYFPDISGGNIHTDCCGPEPESYVDLETGQPLPEKPKPMIWGNT